MHLLTWVLLSPFSTSRGHISPCHPVLLESADKVYPCPHIRSQDMLFLQWYIFQSLNNSVKNNLQEKMVLKSLDENLGGQWCRELTWIPTSHLEINTNSSWIKARRTKEQRINS